VLDQCGSVANELDGMLKALKAEGAIVYNKDKTTAVNIPDVTAEKGMKKLAIKTGISNGTKTEVLSGLMDGQQVILP